MYAIICRELLLKFRSPTQWVLPIVCYVMILLLFPLATGAEPAVLLKISGAALWISALLSVLLGLDGLFKSDLDNGTVEQIIVSGYPLWVWVLIKSFIHWLSGGLVLSVLSLLAIPLFAVPIDDAMLLLGALLLGTPALSMLGAMAAALTVALPNHNVLVALIALPLQLPVLIFGAGVLNHYHAGADIMPIFALLLALSLLAIVLLPFAMAAVLKMTLVD